MLPKAFSALALMALALFSPALAITITNLDEKDYKLVIVEGGKSTEHQLKAAQVIENVCLKGCTIIVDDGEEQYILKEGETTAVVIQEGELYYDGPDPPAPGTEKEPGKADPKAQPAPAPAPAPDKKQ